MIDLSIAVNVAGAALFALVGVGVLLVGRGTRRGLLVGAAATTFGLTWVFENLLASTGAIGALAGVLVFSLLGAASSIALAHHLVRDLARGARTRVAALAAVLTLAWASYEAIFVAGGGSGGMLGWLGRSVYAANVFALVLLVGAIATAFREGGPAPRALAALGLAFGTFVTFLFAAFAGSGGFGASGRGFDALFLGLGVTTAAAILPFARSRGSVDPLSRTVFPTLVAFGLAGLVFVLAMGPDYEEDYGAFGIVRTLGAFFLALAVLKFDLLGVPLPRFAARRGTLATGALAALFIVAQIAQEFFAAEYGLLMGGAVAGALLFAASPIQRALEGGWVRSVGPSGALRAPIARAPRSGALETYRDAVRYALRDGRATRKEEAHLADLAQHLGIGAGDAVRVRHEVEDEREVTR